MYTYNIVKFIDGGYGVERISIYDTKSYLCNSEYVWFTLMELVKACCTFPTEEAARNAYNAYNLLKH